MVALVNAEQTQEIGGDRVGRGAALALPKSGIEVIATAEDGTLASIQCFFNTLKLDQTSSELEVGITDGTIGVFPCGKSVLNPLRPFQSP